MTLVEVVNQVPEALSVLRPAPQQIELHFEVPLSVQLLLDVVVEVRSGDEVSLELHIAGIADVLARRFVHLLPNRHLQAWLRYSGSTEGAEDECVSSLVILECLGDCLSQLGR